MKDYLHTPARLRKGGYRVVFRSGVVIVDFGHGCVLATAVDGGRWMYRHLAFWSEVTAAQRAELLRVAPVCYCNSLPDTGCDFCNGVRSVPEAS